MRSQNYKISLDATPDEVFRAISEGDAITRWFAPEASVTPGVGGSVTLSWGPGMEGAAPISAWEPGKRFAWTEQHGDGEPKVVEFLIEAAEGGKTVLRLVHSGFAEDSNFDAEFDSTTGGWTTFLRLLQFDLAEHKGAPGKHLFRIKYTSRDRIEVLDDLLAAMSFQREGGGYHATLPNGIGINGRVLLDAPKGYLILTLDSLAGGALGLFAEQCGPQCGLTTSWYLKRGATQREPEIAAAWDRLLAGVTF